MSKRKLEESETPTVPAVAIPAALTDEEAKIYDRQMRIWGLETQQKIRQFKVLFLGCFTGVAVEIAKNLVLAGIAGVTLCDDTNISSDSWKGNFFLRQGMTGNIAQNSIANLNILNPNVHVQAIVMDVYNDDILDLQHDYDVVVGNNLRLSRAMQLNEYIRHSSHSSTKQRGKQATSFITVLSSQYQGVWFADWQTYTSFKKDKAGVITETVTAFPSLKKSLCADVNNIYNMTETCANGKKKYRRNEAQLLCNAIECLASLETYIPFIPVAAILGGLISQEILRSIPHEHIPMGGDNWGFFMQNASTVRTINLSPE